MTALRLLLLTPNLDNNSLGRTWCLWLLARHLGHEVQVASVTGDRVWPPLASSELAGVCHRVQPVDRDGRPDPAVVELARRSDVLVAVKPVENSFGLGLLLARTTGRPLLLDVDDPDIEVRTTWLPWAERTLRRLLQPRYRRLTALKREALRTPVLVSNPELQKIYGGRIVPHVRPSVPWTNRPPTRSPVVRFVGSPRGHKGLGVLREAVARLAADGFRLEVTADAPSDAAPWEAWLGTTTVAEGRRLVATADVVVVPSLPGSWSPAQLPAKLVDAMSAGVPVVASDVGPIAWALGDGGVLVPPGDVDALTAALASLAEPGRREQLGRAGYARARATFSVESVAPVFGAQLRALLEGSAPRSGATPRTVVAVLTYRRVDELVGLLPELVRQTGRSASDATPARVLVVDNDPAGGARDAVAALGLPRVDYVHEPVPGIAAARNRALDEAVHDDVLVFLDDDEVPGDTWLEQLLSTYGDHPTCAAVVGPVRSEYAQEPSPWVQAGRFFDRRRLTTGTPVDVAATNNLLLDLHAVRRLGLRFDAGFGISGGSDTLFTRQLSSRGGLIVWCAEAMVVDRVPADRSTASWVLRRALRGGNSWSRTSLALADGRGRRVRLRASLAAEGGGRLLVGLGRAGWGLAVRSDRHQARGMRLVARGGGMLTGALGHIYSEYRRPATGRVAGRGAAT